MGVSVGSAVLEGGMVADGDCVSVGRGGGVEGEQDARKMKEERRARMRVAMGLDMGSILTD